MTDVCHLLFHEQQELKFGAQDPLPDLLHVFCTLTFVYHRMTRMRPAKWHKMLMHMMRWKNIDTPRNKVMYSMPKLTSEA